VFTCVLQTSSAHTRLLWGCDGMHMYTLNSDSNIRCTLDCFEIKMLCIRAWFELLLHKQYIALRLWQSAHVHASNFRCTGSNCFEVVTVCTHACFELPLQIALRLRWYAHVQTVIQRHPPRTQDIRLLWGYNGMQV